MQPVDVLKMDDGCNAAVRANNEAVCEAAEDEPSPGGNLAKFQELAGDGREPRGVEYSFFGYRGSSAEEFVSILLVRDFEKNADQ